MGTDFNRNGALVLGGLVLLVALHESLAAPPAEAGKPVAIVLGRKIHRSELAPDPKTRQSQRAALKPEDYARWEAQAAQEEVQKLQSLVLGPLLNAYATEKGLEPTKQELQSIIVANSWDSESILAKHRKGLERLRAELQREGLTPEQRKALQAELESGEEIEKLSEDDMAKASSQLADAMASMVRGFVLSWKIQRALHRQYGGDIIFQQFGPEAVGAYPPFLEARQKAGDFTLLDEELGRRFWERVRKAPGTRIDDPDALETPWWLKKPGPKR